MARKTASASPSYVVDIENDDWRVVIPIYGKLNPVLHRASFETRGEGEKWRSDADGPSKTDRLQARSPKTS